MALSSERPWRRLLRSCLARRSQRRRGSRRLQRTWLKSGCRRRHRKPQRQAARRRLFLESLECRRVLATFNLDDPTVQDGHTDSLRQAIIDANNNGESDTMNLVAGTYALTLDGAGEDAAATGDLDITENGTTLTIIGAGANSTFIDASALDDRAFHVLSGATLVLRNLSVVNSGASGQAALNQGTVQLENVVIDGTAALTNENTLVATANGHITNIIQGGLLNKAGATLTATTIQHNMTLEVHGGLTNEGHIHLAHSNAGRGEAVTLHLPDGELLNTGSILAVGPGGAPRLDLASGTTLDNQGTIRTEGRGLAINNTSATILNRGTIDVASHDLTVNQSGSGARLESTGSIFIDDGRLLTIDGGTFEYQAGDLAPSGALSQPATLAITDATAHFTPALATGTLRLDLTNSTLNADALLTNQSDLMTVRRSTINATEGMVNEGVLVATENANTVNEIHGGLHNKSGATLTLTAIQHAMRLAVHGGLINEGDVRIAHSNAGRHETVALAVADGELLNTGAILAVGPGGNLNLNLAAGTTLHNQGAIRTDGRGLAINNTSATILNRGTIDIASHDVTINQSGTNPRLETDGDILIGADRTLAISGGAFDYQGGALSQTGTLATTNVDVHFTPAVATAALRLDLTNSTLTADALLTNQSDLMTVRRSTISADAGMVNEGVLVATENANTVNEIHGGLHNKSGATLTLTAIQHTMRLAVHGGLINEGDVRIAHSNAGRNEAVTLQLTDGELLNTGSILAVGPGGAPRLDLASGTTLDNQGTIRTDGRGLAINNTSATILNSGTIDIASHDLTVNQTGSGARLKSTGSIFIDDGRLLTIDGGAFEYQAGDLAPSGALSQPATLAITDATAHFTPALATGTLRLNLTNSTLNAEALLTNQSDLMTVRRSTISADAGMVNEGVLVATENTNTVNEIHGGLHNESGATLTLTAIQHTMTLAVHGGLVNEGDVRIAHSNAGRNEAVTLHLTDGELLNTGSILAVGPGGAPRLDLAADTTLDNQGTIRTDGRGLAINNTSATILNSGTIDIASHDLTINQSGSGARLKSTGSIFIDDGRLLTIDGGAFEYQAGDLAQSGALSQPATLAITDATAHFTPALATGTLRLDLTNSTLTAEALLTNQSDLMTVRRSTINAHAGMVNEGVLVATENANTVNEIHGGLHNKSGATLTLTAIQHAMRLAVRGGLVNEGDVRIAHRNAGRNEAVTLHLADDELLNTGAILAVGPGGAPRLDLAADTTLDNQGLIRTDGRALTVSSDSATVLNSGTIDVSTHDLAVSGPARITHTGTIAVAPDRVLSLGDAVLTQTAGTTTVLGAMTGSSPYSLEGGRLEGTGAATMALNNSGGVVAPGVSPGILSTGSATFGSDGVFEVEINGLTAGDGHDQLQVTGAVGLGGAALDVSASAGSSAKPGDTLTIVLNDGADDAVTGVFAGLPEGAILDVPGDGPFRISYTGGDGNDVTLTRVPAFTYVDDDWAGLSPGDDPDGDGPATGFGLDAFATILEGIDAVITGGTVTVFAGNYGEDVTVGHDVKIVAETAVGGVVTTSVSLAADVLLRCEGTLAAAFSGAAGSTIEAVGDLTLGDGSAVGFVTVGDMAIGGHTVTLLDSNLAELGAGTSLSGGVLVAAGGVLLGASELLFGEGQVQGAVVVDGGVLSPGASLGTIETGDLSFPGGGAVVMEINGTAAGVDHDQLRVTGAVDLTGATLDLSNTAGYASSVGDVIRILDNDGDDAITGTFAGLPQNATVDVPGAGTFRISYTGGDGNDVVIIRAAAGTLDATLVEGTLTITDTAADGADNQLTVSLSGTDLVITDANETFASAPDGATLANDNRTLTLPLASVTGALNVDLAGGDDLLTIDFSSGNPVPAAGLDYDGGSNGPAGDALALLGGAFHTSTFTYMIANDGSLALDPDGPGGADASLIRYAALEPIASSIASDVVELIFSGGDETITVGDAGGGQTTVDSTLGEITTFINPTERLEITATGGADLIQIDSLAGGYASLVIAGDDVSDVVNFNGPLTFAADHSLTVSDVGTINLPNAASDLATSGSGAVNLTALRNIALASGSSIATVHGGVTLSANQQMTLASGSFVGIDVRAATITTTGAGHVSLTGHGGDTGDSNYGIELQNRAQVQSTASGADAGTITLDGVGGAGGPHNHGLLIDTADVTSVNGNIQITGQGGDGTGNGNAGVRLSSALVSSTGTGADAATIAINGAGGGVGGSSDANSGVWMAGTSPTISSVNGAIQITGEAGVGASTAIELLDADGILVTGAAPVMLVGDSMDLAATSAVAAGANTVTLAPRTNGTAIDLGGADSAVHLGLTDDELDRITAGTLVLGDSNSGRITISTPITRPASTDIELHSGGAILFNPGSLDTAGGNLLLAPGEDVQPITGGVEVAASTLSFATASALNIRIDGAAVDTGYSQLNVAGMVDLTGAALVISGAYSPGADETFVIVNNDGADPILGTFDGLPQGSAVSVLGVDDFRIRYDAGDGNDVALVRPALEVFVDDGFAGTPLGDDPDGDGPATAMGFDAFATIQEGIDGVKQGGTVHIAAGAYRESVVVDKDGLLLDGPEGQASTAVVEFDSDHGIRIAADGVTVEDLRVTHVGDVTINNGIVAQNVDSLTLTRVELLDSTFGLRAGNLIGDVTIVGGLFSNTLVSGISLLQIGGSVSISDVVVEDSGLTVSEAGDVALVRGTFSSSDISLGVVGNVAVSETSVHGGGAGGLSVTHAPSVQITGGSFKSSGSGIRLSNIAGAVSLSDGVTADDNTHEGLVVSNAASVSIVGGSFSDNRGVSDSVGGGVVLNNIGGAVQLHEVTANGNGEFGIWNAVGLEVSGAESLTVVGGSFSQNATGGVAVSNVNGASPPSGDDPAPANVTLSGVVVQSNLGPGLVVADSDSLELTNVTLANAGPLLNAGPSSITSVHTMRLTVDEPPNAPLYDLVEINTPDIGGAGRFRHTRAAQAQDAVEFDSASVLTVSTGAGADTVRVGAHADTRIVLNGGGPAAAPGDVLTYLSDGEHAFHIRSDSIATTDHALIEFEGFETVGFEGDPVNFLVVESDGATEVSESGTSDTFTVVLSAKPASNVVIDVASGDPGEAVVDQSSPTFTPDNWDQPQTVTVTGVDDAEVDGDQTTAVTLSVNAGASDDAFDNVPDQTVNVVTRDDDETGQFSILRFDFGQSLADTAVGFTSVSPADVYSDSVGYGWAVHALAFDRATPTPLLRDGHYGRSNMFSAQVPDGEYRVSVTIGDASYTRNRIDISAENVLKVDDAGAAAGTFAVYSFNAAVSDGRLDVQFAGFSPNFVVNAMEIRSAADVVDHSLTRDGGVTFVGAASAPGALVTVAVDRGVVATTDADEKYVGIQVQADSNGQFAFDLAPPPVGGAVAITTQEIGGGGEGVVEHIFPFDGVRFDFNSTFRVTAEGFVSVGPLNWFDVSRGYGWANKAGTFDRFGPDALRRDGHWGRRNVFSADVPNGQYQVNVTLGDLYYRRDRLDIYAEGILVVDDAASAAGQFIHRSFPVEVADGRLDLRFHDQGGDPYFTVNALEIFPLADVVDHGLTHTGDGTFAGTASAPGTLITVTADKGRIVTPDADPRYAGVQVQAGADGAFIVQLDPPPVGVMVEIATVEVSGTGRGQASHVLSFAPLRLDFNNGASPTEEGYVGVAAGLAYAPKRGYGWTSSASFDRGAISGTNATANFQSLLRDGHWAGSSFGTKDFRVDLPDGAYEVTVTMGDASYARDHMAVTVKEGHAGGSTGISGISTAAGQFVHRTFATSISGGHMTLRFSDAGGDPYWTLNGITIRAAAATFTLSASANSIEADGASTVTYTASGVPDGLYTVSSTLGTITNADADGRYAGTQVLVSGGSLSFTVQSTSASGTAQVSAVEVTNAAHDDGTTTTEHTTPEVRRFDFNGRANHTQGPAGGELGFIGVRGGDTYSSARGYGWQKPAQEFQRGTTGYKLTDTSYVPLFRDGAYASDRAPRTFQVQVAPGKSGPDYDVRVYVGDRNYARAFIQVTIEGAASPRVAKATTANQFTSVELTGHDTDGDGVLTITIADIFGATYWVVNGIDVALAQSADGPGLPGAAKEELAPGTAALGGAIALTSEQLASAQQSALAIWSGAGLSAEQARLLAGTPIGLRDFGSQNVLGLAYMQVVPSIWIDDDAAGVGWHVDSASAPADGRVDLLTVVLHEMGHILGLEDLDHTLHPDDLMADALGAGVRRLPAGAGSELASGLSTALGSPSGVLDLAFAEFGSDLSNGRSLRSSRSSFGAESLASRADDHGERLRPAPPRLGGIADHRLLADRESLVFARERSEQALDAFFADLDSSDSSDDSEFAAE